MFLYHCTIVLAQICCYHIRILMKEEEHMEKTNTNTVHIIETLILFMIVSTMMFEIEIQL